MKGHLTHSWSGRGNLTRQSGHLDLTLYTPRMKPIAVMCMLGSK